MNQALRSIISLSLAIASCMVAFIGVSPTGGQDYILVLGPGSLPPFYSEHYSRVHILDGTEILATGSYPVHPDAPLTGLAAISGYFAALRIDGGVFHGASLSLSDGTITRAGGGAALGIEEGDFKVEIFGGEYVGGSVVTNGVPLLAAYPAPSVVAGRYVQFEIHGGKFVGGVVSETPIPTPAELANRGKAFSLSFLNSLDIYGGEFVGDIVIDGSMRVHGRDLTITPSPVPVLNTPFVQVLGPFTLSGVYLDGTPFSMKIDAGVRDDVMLRDDSMTFGGFNVPEPTTFGMLILAAISGFAARRAVGKRAAPGCAPPRSAKRARETRERREKGRILSRVSRESIPFSSHFLEKRTRVRGDRPRPASRSG